MMSKSDIKKAIRLGASLLRKYDAKWFEKIDKCSLNLRDSNHCILAQVFGGRTGFIWAVHTIFTPDIVILSDSRLTSCERHAYDWLYCMCDHGFEPYESDDIPGFVDEWVKFSEYLRTAR